MQEAPGIERKGGQAGFLRDKTEQAVVEATRWAVEKISGRSRCLRQQKECEL